jgi:hypothetical protein
MPNSFVAQNRMAIHQSTPSGVCGRKTKSARTHAVLAARYKHKHVGGPNRIRHAGNRRSK